ncbi:protein Shroom4 [Rhynochetos jubatus]
MERAEGRPGAPQYVHVQLQGGAPWGFTLRGGLEHGEPLIVSKVEEGGKAALSRLQPGDELVSISGTPLYGSRHEALILIKGSYRSLKMIVRRRSVPVLRPHSWHVAKLADSCPDAPAMHCPADAFSLSWPSGCDVSELSLQWNLLSRHCSTDRSSSIGSMESLDQPGQAFYEGDPSPVDQGMYHSKRDSAYSSFSASSVASDCALSLRPEEAASADSGLQGPCKLPDGRYLATGAEPPTGRHPEAWRAPVPPQPPVRRDSLRAAPAGGGDRRRAVASDMLHAKGRWISDTFLCQRDGEAEAGGGPSAPYPTKDRLSADQYYMLSSPPDTGPAELLRGQSVEPGERPYSAGTAHRVPDAAAAGDAPLPSPLKGHAPHRHSAPEQLLAAQLRSLQVGAGSGQASPASDSHRWTLSPLHPEGSCPGAAQDPPLCPEPCRRLPPCRCCPEPQRACQRDGRGASLAHGTEGPPEEESQAGGRRARGPPHRSAQLRRRSDRFATSLRNEIQRRKAQLQKSRGPGAPASEGPVEEADEPPDGSVPPEGHHAPAERLSPAPSDEVRSPGRSGDHGIPTSDPQGPPSSPERAMPVARGRWRWSPERKLQRQRLPGPGELEGYDQGPVARSPQLRGEDEAVLLPFADRRRFFEESSQPAPSRHSKALPRDPGAFQPPEPRDARCLSVDPPYGCPSPERPGSASPYTECCREQPPCYKPLGRPGELEYLRGFYPYGGPLRPEPCRYCGGDLRPPQLPRGHPCRCHPQPWARCPDCCCPAPRAGREESDAWPPRRAFAPEFPLDKWEPPLITRKASQSLSELSRCQLGFPRHGPFRPCVESAEPEWPPCYRATSTHDLSWDGDGPARSPEGPPDPPPCPLRGRAFSESHLNLEPPSPRGRRDLLRAKLNSPGIPKKKGPPPPRPPPPNWEKYRQRQMAQRLPDAPGHGSAFVAPVPTRGIAEAGRERSQSLTGEQGGRARGHAARPPVLLGAWPPPQPPRSQRRMPEPDAGSLELCRAAGAGEERPKAKHPWEMEEQPQRLGQNQEQGWAGPCGVRGGSLLLRGPVPTTPEGPQPLPGAAEEASCRGGWPQPLCGGSEELLWDVRGRDPSLAGVPAPLGTAPQVTERQAWRECFQQDWRLEALAQDRPGFEPISPPPGTAATTYSYCSAPAGKPEPLGEVRELPEALEHREEEEEEEELVKKKLQLIESLSRKLAVLREAQRGLQEDISANGALGEDVATRLQALCTPVEFDKYRLFVGDLDKVVNLLLSLSGRLARVETALDSLGPHAPAEDKVALREKRRLLAAQLEDARELQEHVGRREAAVGAMVARYLPAEHLQDYQHFLKMKSALITEQRELEQKIKLGQEQLRCLRESLGQAPPGC